MTRSLAVPAVLALCFAALAPRPVPAQGPAPKTFSVSDARGFLQAIGPDRTIVLKKGDYDLSSARGVSNRYVEWQPLEGGEELRLKGLRNLTIRGAYGARIVSRSAATCLLTVMASSDVTLDSLRFVRELGEGEAPESDAFYGEELENFVMDRCSFEGPSLSAISLWSCPGARIRRATIEGATRGALYAIASTGIELSGSKVSGVEGYPLLYIEDCDEARFERTDFSGCFGGNFIEIYSGSGEVGSILFSGCGFYGVEVDYFCGTDLLPSTEDCAFEGSSFGEDWPESSVAYFGDEEYYGGDDYYEGGEGYGEEDYGPAYYAHPSSGLGFQYPREWELRESADSGRVGLFSPSGDELVLFVTVLQLDAKADPEAQAKRVFSDAAAALIAYLGDEMGLDLAIGPAGAPVLGEGLVWAAYSGEATMGEGERAEARVRLLVSEGSVHALVALARDAAAFEEGMQTAEILASADYMPRGE